MKNKRHRSADPNQDDRKRNDALNKSDKNADKRKLPGDYPPNEDIMNRMNTQRVGMDVENFSRTIGTENFNIKERVTSNPEDIKDDPLAGYRNRDDEEGMEQPVPKNYSEDSDDAERQESDVTDEDMEALGPKDLSMDMGEDEQILKSRVWPVDMAGKDLDVPGAELDDDNEAIGSEDEENNPYSLGGDGHEDNLEGK